MDLSVVIPVYNGAAFLEQSARSLQHYLRGQPFAHEVVLVNDGSTDDTPAVMERLADDEVTIVSLETNRGKFAALREGMLAARGTCRAFTDADVPYDHSAFAHMERLVNRRRYHLVVGDRTLGESECGPTLPPLRRLMSWGFRQVVRLFITGGMPDSQCGLKALRGDVAEAIFPLLTDEGFAGDVELVYIALKYNLEIRRIPVRLQRQGPSTVRPFWHWWRMLGTLVSLRYHWTSGHYDSPALRGLAAQRYWENASSEGS